MLSDPVWCVQSFLTLLPYTCDDDRVFFVVSLGYWFGLAVCIRSY